MRVVREETREEDYQHFFNLLNKGLTIDEIKERLQHKELYDEYDPEVEKRVVREEALEDGIEIGMERGLREGLKEGREEILKLFEQGLSVEEIKERIN